ncbi:hypothetical protein LHFGNBLO_006047 (plasmid) [Mesorhizobium sp. AR10]|uniref:hypothetical protein n=1 Tax=Mesorhizobium sp. AR10 TaxID=2865839 RepID=UPI00215F3FD9|nr:hypothetical protein [Mesorhizobium sp. AR10]UVK35830.1 hypothetical protein LHFGNBLO_006047 [Mesorhizobium sp. AR10]
MRIVYLDQNKWIDLARAFKKPDDHTEFHKLLQSVRTEVVAGRLVLPLTSTNLYETYKVADTERRRDLAFVQAVLSKGLVFRGRQKRLEVEVGRVVADHLKLPMPDTQDDWFLSNVFFEATAEWEDERLGLSIPEKVVAFIRSNPVKCLYDHLVEAPDDHRLVAVQNFSRGTDRLRSTIEERRGRNAGESLAMRRRIQGARLLINDLDLIVGFANKMGAGWQSTADIGKELAHRLVDDVPTYHIEREIALRIEAQSRPLEENDFRDMASFCAVVAYADMVTGENQFVNLARQAKLGKKYETRLETSVLALRELLETDAIPQ